MREGQLRRLLIALMAMASLLAASVSTAQEPARLVAHGIHGVMPVEGELHGVGQRPSTRNCARVNWAVSPPPKQTAVTPSAVISSLQS